MRLLRSAAAIVMALSCGCSGDETTREASSSEDLRCPAGEMADLAGHCGRAGLPADMPCPPGAWPVDDVCTAAGVPPDGCADGFLDDALGGCVAALPARACAPGTMAVPGETECHDVGACGTGPWGGIPVEADTQYVDAAYGGGDSDGSAARPWTIIADALNAAAEGGMVALAAGSYFGDVPIVQKAVRLWGRCPQMVEIVGDGSGDAALAFVALDQPAELHAVAVRGSAFGIVVSAVDDLLLDRVWIHDVDPMAIAIQDDVGPASVIIRDSLIEATPNVGILLRGTELVLERSVVRDVVVGPDGSYGRGMIVDTSSDKGAMSRAYVRRSVFERNREVGIEVAGSTLVAEGVLFRSMLPSDNADFGLGILAHPDVTLHARPNMTCTGCVFEDTLGSAIALQGADALVEATVVRRTLSQRVGSFGRGIVSQNDSDGGRSALVATGVLVEDSGEYGVVVGNGEATLERVLVRRAGSAAPTQSGVGIAAVGTEGPATSLIARGCRVEQVLGLGVAAWPSELELDGVAVSAMVGDERSVGIGVAGADGVPSTLVMRRSLVEDGRVAGIVVVDGHALIEMSEVRRTTGIDGAFGDGIVALAQEQSTSIEMRLVLVQHSDRAAVSSFGGHVEIAQSMFTCQALDFDAETILGFTAAFVDGGGNGCGCPEPSSACRHVSAGLAPPGSLGPAPAP